MDNHHEILKNFGQRASDYRLSTTHGNPVDLERMINLLKPTSDAYALDVATGGGHTAFALAKYVNNVVAIDITPEIVLDCSVFDGEEPERELNRVELLRDSSHQCSYSPRQWNELLKELPLTLLHTSLLQEQYKLPQWFDRMGTNQTNRQEIFRVLNDLSEDCKIHYPFKYFKAVALDSNGVVTNLK